MLVQAMPYPPAAAAPASPVGINNESASKTATGGLTATASFTFATDRTVKDQDGSNLDASWLQSGYSAADYQIRVTKISGATPTGTLGSWLGLSANRMWSLSQSAGAAGSASCQLKVEIRAVSDPGVILDEATYTLTADSLAGDGTDGGGGVSPNWADISGTTTIASISKTNAAQTMSAAGTLNIAYVGSGITYAAFKNGVSLGADTSFPVADGDTVYFQATASGMTAGGYRTGTITVSGLCSDSIDVYLERLDSGGTGSL